MSKETLFITNPEILDYIRGHIVQTDAQLRNLEHYAAEHHVPIIQPEGGQFLRMMTGLCRPMRILEIGTAIGYSGLIMLDAAGSPGAAELHTVELSENTAAVASDNFKASAFADYVVQHIGDGEEVMDQLISDGVMPFDLIFIDAAKGQYNRFFDKALLLLAEGGTILCDNVLYRGWVIDPKRIERRNRTMIRKMGEFISRIMGDEQFDTTLIPVGDGMAVIKLRRKHE